MTEAILHDPSLEQALTEAALSALDRTLANIAVSTHPALLERVFALPSASAQRGQRRAKYSAARLASFGEVGPTRFQLRLLADALAPRGWRLRLGGLLDRLLRRTPQPPAILDPTRKALAASVWSGPAFRRAAALRLYRRLRTEVLMTPEPVALPTFSNDFWWVLIGTFSDSTPLGTALRAAGAESSAGMGWAGFWEQYLLLRARGAGGELPTGAELLPLVRFDVRALDSGAHEPEDPDAARRGWREEGPGWALSLVGGTF